VNILLLSAGGGGGNILRSVKALFRRDLAVTQKVNPRYAERLRRAVTTRFLDTNEFSLSDVPPEERVLIGSGASRRLGSMHNPDVAREALHASRDEVEALLARYSTVIIIGTGGKGTGAGTMVPLAQMARRLKKLVIPIFVVPSFERHEVEKRRHDHALKVVDQFDAAKIRLVEILNDRGYVDSEPESQAVVWERMNMPIARGLRGLLYVLGDLSQVDPSDLSMLFAGPGRLRLEFAEIDPPAGQEPSDEQIRQAVRGCWENPYYNFTKPIGTSLICIQGDWSNIVDSKIKGGLAALSVERGTDSPYNPLYARAFHAPKPWGVTALFAEYTGKHAPLEIEWPHPAKTSLLETNEMRAGEMVTATSPPQSGIRDQGSGIRIGDQPSDLEPPNGVAAARLPVPTRTETEKPAEERSFATFWEFALALQRSDPAALALASSHERSAIPIDGAELKRLLGTVWFRSSVLPRLSKEWRDRVLEALVASVTVPDHALKVGRHTVHVSELGHAQLQEVLKGTFLPDAVRADLQLLVTVGSLWGEDALRRFTGGHNRDTAGPSKLALLLQPFRGT
jgi:cell division GTPase FtsZ